MSIISVRQIAIAQCIESLQYTASVSGRGGGNAKGGERGCCISQRNCSNRTDYIWIDILVKLFVNMGLFVWMQLICVLMLYFILNSQRIKYHVCVCVVSVSSIAFDLSAYNNTRCCPLILMQYWLFPNKIRLKCKFERKPMHAIIQKCWVSILWAFFLSFSHTHRHNNHFNAIFYAIR